MSMSNPPNQAVDTSHTALDEINLLLFIVDSDLRTKFINRAFYHMLFGLLTNQEFPSCYFEDLMRFVVRKRRVLAPVRIQFLR